MSDCTGAHARSSLLSRLTQPQREQMHDASLQILERIGVRLYEPEAVVLARKAGARITDGNIAHIPPRLVEWALSTAPGSVTLHDRKGRPVMRVEGNCSFFGPGSDSLNIVDHRTGQRRPAVLQDVVDGITLCDALPHIDFVMSMFLPSDCPAEIADRYQMEVMLNHTAKPIVFVSYEAPGCIDAVEMAEIVAGGRSALRERPFVACYVNVTTGLRHNKEALQKLLFMADRGLPVMYIPVVLAGATGPITVAGTLALVNAGALAGLVLAQAKREGAPVIMPGWGGEGLDMHSLVNAYAEPDHRGAAESLVHQYGLPMFSLAAVTDSKLVDQQAAIEAALTLIVDVLAGGQIIHDLGYLESGLTGSLAQLAICHEAASWIRHFLRPIEVSEEALAMELIEHVGHDGQFLDAEHTLRHYRERWRPQLVERNTYDGWLAKGGQSMAERAAAYVDGILRSHQPEPLPADVAAAVHAVVERAGGPAAR